MAVHYRRFLPEDEKEHEPGSDCPLLCPPRPPSKHQTTNILIISLCVFAVGLIFISYFAVRRFRSRRRNSPPPENDTFRDIIVDELQAAYHPFWYIRTIGLPQSAIDSIEVFRFKKREKLTEGSDCSVCLSKFEEDEELRLLPKCSHAFHVPCIDTWLRAHTNCPVCRAAVMSGGANEVNSEEVSSSNSESMEEEDEEREVEIDEREGDNGRNWRVRVMSDLAEYRVKIDPEMEPVRRSVSMNVTSASATYQCSER